MRIHLFALFFLLTGSSSTLRAQLVDREAFDFVDRVIDKMGPMRDSSLAAIVREATAPCHDEICQLRGIYMWVVKNIECECAPSLNVAQTNGTASYTFQYRRGTSQGFASLVTEMCRMRSIHCEMVSGLVKTQPWQIGNMSEKTDLGFWNILRADGRWFVMDAYLGAGTCTGKTFTKETTDAWLMVNRRLFTRSHLPAKEQKQLVDSPRTRSAFIAGPSMGAISAILGVFPMPAQRGLLRARADSTITLRFQMWPASMTERVQKVDAICDGTLFPAEFESAEDTLIVRFAIPKEGKYVTQLRINNSPAWSFQTHAGPSIRKREETAADRRILIGQ